MSSTAAFVRHYKLQTDRAISEAYSRLRRHPLARDTFSRLLGCVRERAGRLLMAPIIDGHHPGVSALVHLAQFRHAHIRSISAWRGCKGSWWQGADSLAQHLMAIYPVPRFLSSAWYAPESQYSDEKRRWFIAHAGGASFRSLDLPLRVTRRMEHLFLSSPDHLSIECALRRAELVALGAGPSLVDTVLASRRGTDLSNGDLWRTVWIFLVNHSEAIAPEPRLAAAADGAVASGFWGRRRRPVVAFITDSAHGPCGAFPRSGRAADVWEFVELTNSAQLKAEGAALRHCVARYAHYCGAGTSRIWSLRSRRDSEARAVITIEIRRNAIVQARGFRNRLPKPREMELLRTWAAREGLCLAV